MSAEVWQRTGRFDRIFDGSDLYGLRTSVAAYLTGVVDDGVNETAVLIAHELCSNAVRHGGGSGRIQVWAAPDGLHCEVSDQGPGLADPAHAGMTLPPPSLPGGRGLWIARRMSDLRIATGTSGTTITAIITYPTAPPAAQPD